MTLRHLYNTWVSPQRWLERAGVSAPVRIVSGLVILVVCVLLLAKAARLFPNDDELAIKRRAVICEMTAVQAASGATHENYAVVREAFNATVRRYEEVLSVCLWSSDGLVRVETAGHEKHWAGAQPYVSSPIHIRIPLFAGQKLWGQVEISFKPIPQPLTWVAWCSTPMAQLMVFIAAALFLLFWLYLSRMLKVLDPSAAIPQRMQLLMDTLVEGMVVLDKQNRIVMANQSFANTVFSPVEKLIGRDLSSLPWMAQDSESDPEFYPWVAAVQSDLQQRAVPMRLRVGTRHSRSLKVNVSPIAGSKGTHGGVLVTFDDQTVVEADNFQLAQFITKFSDEIREFHEQFQSHMDDRQLAKMEGLARSAGELAQLCQSASTPNNDLTTVTKGSGDGEPLHLNRAPNSVKTE